MRLFAHPILCNYYVTYRCNARCSFCDIWERPSPYVSIEDAKQNIRDLRRLGVRVIDFTGGEPLLHRKLAELLALAKSHNLITTITTNGLLYPKYAQRLRGLVDMLHFSLDYFDAGKHNASRGVACYDKVMESIDLALSLGERPDILFTAFNQNINEIEPIYQNICRPNRLLLIINPVFDYNGVETGGGLSEENLDVLSQWGKRKWVYLNQAFISLRRDGGNHIDRPVCKAGSSTVVIGPGNTLILPCYHLGIKELHLAGNLFALYQSEEVQEAIGLEGRLPECEGCTINCYMQPSFASEISRYWWQALPSTIKYSALKGTWKELLARRGTETLTA